MKLPFNVDLKNKVAVVTGGLEYYAELWQKH